MSLAHPQTVTDVFMANGIGTDIIAPLLQIQELALAVSLQRRYQVMTRYHGGAQLYRIHVRDGVGQGTGANDNGLQRQHELIEIHLPQAGRPTPYACAQLGEAANTLHRYLRGVQS